ncbi:unnamed protein product [Ilex paraguariensis]|uniref:Homeobox domain-containing protein n=1 Tax=Ilex paraguariensis TaxID=185542 RepID=A0ABC8TRV8_9AQUA
MAIAGNSGVGSSRGGNSKRRSHGDGGKHARYTAPQIEVLEKCFGECSKPNNYQRQEMIRANPVLGSVDSKQIKIWFQNRRCRDKQRKENTDLQLVNQKLIAENKLLMEENGRLRNQVTELVYENKHLRQHLKNVC